MNETKRRQKVGAWEREDDSRCWAFFLALPFNRALGALEDVFSFWQGSWAVPTSLNHFREPLSDPVSLLLETLVSIVVEHHFK